jgi:hypothetical protein
VTSGRFRYVAERDILGARAPALEWLIGRCEATELWADTLAYVEEYLQLSQSLTADYPRRHDKWRNIKAACEWELLQQSLVEAEDNHDFEECLFILDDMEDRVIQQKATPGMARSSITVLGQKQLAFWRDAYGKHCLSCARWIQNKPPERPRPKPTPIFRVPLGLVHNPALYFRVSIRKRRRFFVLGGRLCRLSRQAARKVRRSNSSDIECGHDRSGF